MMFYENFESNYKLILDYLKILDVQSAVAERDGAVPYIQAVTPGEISGKEVALRVVQ